MTDVGVNGFINNLCDRNRLGAIENIWLISLRRVVPLPYLSTIHSFSQLATIADLLVDRHSLICIFSPSLRGANVTCCGRLGRNHILTATSSRASLAQELLVKRRLWMIPC